MGEEQWFECDWCGLKFTVTASNDAEIMAGEPFVVYCPRCGEEDGLVSL